MPRADQPRRVTHRRLPCPRTLSPTHLGHPPQANGVGASWWPAQFCAGTDSSSVNVVMTELASTLEL